MGFELGDRSAFWKTSDNGDVGELLEGDIIAAASDWEACGILSFVGTRPG